MAEPNKQTGKAATSGKQTGKAAENKQQISAEDKAKIQQQQAEEEAEARGEYVDGGKRVSGKMRIRLLYKYGIYPPGALIYVDAAVGQSMVDCETAKEVK